MFHPPPMLMLAPVSVSFREFRRSTGNNSSVTFSNVTWGDGGKKRTLVAGILNYNIRSSTPRTVSGLTIGGNAATLIASSSAPTSTTAWEAVFFAVRDNTGDLKDAVISFSGGSGSYFDQGIWLGAWSVYSLRSLTPVDTDAPGAGTSSATISRTVDTEKGGIALAAAVLNRNTSFTTTGVTERFDDGYGSDTATAVGGDTLTTGASVTASFTKATGSAAIIVGAAVSLR